MKITEIVEKLTNEITSQLTKAGDKDTVTKETVVEGCFPQASSKEKKAYMVTLGAIMDLGLLPEFQSVKRAGIKLASYVPKNSVMLAERAAKAEAREKRVATKLAEKAAARAVAKAEKTAAREAAKEAEKVAKETAKAEKAAARKAAKEAEKAAKEVAKAEKAAAKEATKTPKKPVRALHPAHQK